MSTTISYKGSTIATAENQTKTLNTAGKYMEADVVITDVSQPNLQSKTYTVDSAGTETITADAGYDGLSEVEVSVPSADPFTSITGSQFITENNQRKWTINAIAEVNVEDGDVEGWLPDGFSRMSTYKTNAVPSNTSVTPTESAQTIGGANTMMEGAVTVNAIPSNYVGTGITRRSSADLTAWEDFVIVPVGYYAQESSMSVGTTQLATPTATKGSVSNHSVSVTPSINQPYGYTTGGTKTGTAVTVTAAELVSGSQTITENGTVDVTNLASVTVDVQGGGSSAQVDTAISTGGDDYTVIFTGLKGQPSSFYVSSDVLISTTGQAVIAAMVYDGSSIHTQTIINTTNAQVSYVSTGVSYTYSNGTLTVTSTGPVFTDDDYLLTYTYGGSASAVDTFNVQVGSGATSITFTGLADEPIAWSCIFKSNFGTSSGYQRVIATGYNGTNVIGLAMDSAAHPSNSYWTQSYNNGSLTITSNGTNQGGYFHQPGYYQLTAIYGESSPYQTKIVTPTTSQQVVEPDSGYDALSQVTVNPIPSEYIIPTGNYAITQNGNNINIAQYATVSVNVSGGGVNVATTTWTNSSTSTVSHQFTGLSGTPKAAFLRCTTQLTRSSSNTYYYIADIVWDGTNTSGNYHLRSSGAYTNVPSTGTAKYNVTVGTNSITFSSTATSRSSAPGSFYNGTYELVYVY